MKKNLLIIGLFAASALLPAHALSQEEVKRCNAMAASFAAKKAEIVEAKAVLDKKAEMVETLGEQWEEAETHKLASPAHAKAAADAKAEWEGLKGEVLKAQFALQSKVQMLNSDVTAFNASCAQD